MNGDDILGYASNNISTRGTTAHPILPSERISTILPPRIFRVGATISF